MGKRDPVTKKSCKKSSERNPDKRVDGISCLFFIVGFFLLFPSSLLNPFIIIRSFQDKRLFLQLLIYEGT